MARWPEIDDTTPEALAARLDELVWRNFTLHEALSKVAERFEQPKPSTLHVCIAARERYDLARLALERTRPGHAAEYPVSADNTERRDVARP